MVIGRSADRPNAPAFPFKVACQQRKHSKGPTRSHSRHRPKYYLEARSTSPDRRREAFGVKQPFQQRPYAPETPLAIPAIDSITSAYQAGKEDAMAERFGFTDRVAQKLPQIIRPVIQRIIEPRNIVQRQAEEYISRRDFNRRELDQKETEGGNLNGEDLNGEDLIVERLNLIEDNLILNEDRSNQDHTCWIVEPAILSEGHLRGPSSSKEDIARSGSSTRDRSRPGKTTPISVAHRERLLEASEPADKSSTEPSRFGYLLICSSQEKRLCAVGDRLRSEGVSCMNAGVLERMPQIAQAAGYASRLMRVRRWQYDAGDIRTAESTYSLHSWLPN
ncbi:hypothetical protein MBM_02846 [Drepanopeziza brunnea f. sp. 'multigermtubi' MB_m1]|uniref:Uncharacterized protein n=1 Tax=Marssonina brunnea f. sp. multigermtubi (strain MB_m1) TaxID=1072389 RepID=K1Y394_MARBU|nr:uncharacterized protein MBM_02846 [Drepanopeziza brunnea f. sp. 'multigermtubi' MB_m1]EKD19609.1 hypothetical protein MBM_02846 [Drepanopeziza brunnea f. sp. 'multigermtubi' MB_m1]